MDKTSPAKKFYELDMAKRRKTLAAETGLTDETVKALSGIPGLTDEQANHMVENAIGTFALPLGIAQNFVVNGRPVLVPMAIEESSVIAGASFMAKLARSGGGFSAKASEPEMIGQMQL